MSENPENSPPSSHPATPRPAGKSDREARLADALRANLRRRKVTTRRQKTQDPQQSPRTGDEVTDGQR
ncbi:MAG TPA: hypothetical protein DDW95_00270 [Alphaproteobacteria bacterium]|nr:hypothetical protein [Alphaproteobacteria bacterium]HBA42858.1 hypothetical protein [Alphaproteobacteria bacterium]HBF96957.1 hypothetical protein [Alphaproteobacteria bacterium]